MRVLVTGAGGFVGHAVTAALADRGHEPVAFVRRPETAPEGVEMRVGDIRDLDAMRAAAADVDGVCHLAGLTRVRDSLADPIAYWRTNLGGTLNVLEALADKDEPPRLVLASTAAVYSPHQRQPLTEDAVTAPENPYGASKLAADLAASNVAATGAIGAISLRAFNIAGAANGVTDRDVTRLIPKVLAVQAGLEDELVINGDGSAVRDFVHVLDMAQAFVLALDACRIGEWRAYNVGSGLRTAVTHIVAVAERVTARPVCVRYAAPRNEPAVLLADNARTQKSLGWHPENSEPEAIFTDAWQAFTASPAIDGIERRRLTRRNL